MIFTTEQRAAMIAAFFAGNEAELKRIGREIGVRIDDCYTSTQLRGQFLVLVHDDTATEIKL